MLDDPSRAGGTGSGWSPCWEWGSSNRRLGWARCRQGAMGRSSRNRVRRQGGSVVLGLSLYRQVMCLSQGSLADGVTSVLELHTPQNRAGVEAGAGDCPQCQVPSPCPTVHVLSQRLGIPAPHGGWS